MGQTRPATGSGSDDLLWRASIDDRTVEFFDRFDRRLSQVEQNSQQAFSGVDKGMKQSSASGGALIGIFSSLTTAVIGFGMQAVSSIKGFLSGAVDLRARVDTLGVALNHVGNNAGYTSDQIAEAEEQLKSLGITTSAARSSILRMIRANIDLADATKLARIAQDSAVIAGINSSQAFERLILGIQKMEPELLDELGIQLRRNDAYERFAKTLGVNAKALTDVQKQEAILQEIYRQSGVVAGAYEASMGTVGKQITSLPRYIEELQLSLGGIFQPAQQAKIQFYTESLKSLQKWVDENKESLDRLATGLGAMAQQLFKWFSQVINFLAGVPEKLKDAEGAITTIMGKLAGLDDTEIKKRVDGMGQTIAQAITLFVTFFATGVQTVLGVMEFVAGKAGELLKVIKGEMTLDEVRASTDEFAANFRQQIEETAKTTFNAVGIMTGALEDTSDAAEETAEEVVAANEEIAESAEDLSGVIKQVDDAFRSLQKRLERQSEDDALKEIRRQTEDALQESFRLEDIERGHQERLKSIREQYEKSRADAQTDYNEAILDLHESSAERKIQIEEDYQKRLLDLQREYEYRASDLARTRDAIGLVKLMEEHRRSLDAEKRNKDEAKQQEEKNLADRLKNLQEAFAKQNQEIQTALAEQLAQAEQTRAKELEDYQRSLDRQRQIRELHNQWEAEDRQRALQRELEDMAEQFANIEGLTDEHLATMLEKWSEYFGDLTSIMEDFNELRDEMAFENMSPNSSGGVLQGDDERGSQRGWRRGGTTRGSNDPMRDDGRTRTPQSTPFGQMGQVSQALTNMPTQAMAVQRLQPVPVMRRDRLEIHVTAEGLEPVIQRQLVNIITEIERNRTS